MKRKIKNNINYKRTLEIRDESFDGLVNGVEIISHEIIYKSSGVDVIDSLKESRCIVEVLNDSQEVDELLTGIINGVEVRLVIKNDNYTEWDGLISSNGVKISDESKPYVFNLESKDGIHGLSKYLL